MNDSNFRVSTGNIIVHEWPRITARSLDQSRMIRFEERTDQLHATDLGRTASHFYVQYDKVEILNERMHQAINDAETFAMFMCILKFV
jgi:activating signal cointegrator complex subunit 3